MLTYIREDLIDPKAALSQSRRTFSSEAFNEMEERILARTLPGYEWLGDFARRHEFNTDAVELWFFQR